MQVPFFGQLPTDTIPIPGHPDFYYSEAAGVIYRHRTKSYMVYHTMYPAGWYEVLPEQRYKMGKGWPLSERAIKRLCFPDRGIEDEEEVEGY